MAFRINLATTQSYFVLEDKTGAVHIINRVTSTHVALEKDDAVQARRIVERLAHDPVALDSALNCYAIVMKPQLHE